MGEPETGSAVDAWYRQFRSSGLDIAGDPPAFPDWETDLLDADRILAVQRMLRRIDDGVFDRAVHALEDLKEGLRSLPQTLNHNDFGWSNLAVSRCGDARGIVFDYHQRGLDRRAVTIETY